MELGLAAIIVDVALNVGGWIGQGAKNKKERKTLELAASLQAFNVSSTNSALSPLSLASAMNGAMTVPLASEVIETAAFKNLTQELFIASLTDANSQKMDSIKKSFRSLFKQKLHGRVEKTHSNKFSDYILSSLESTVRVWISELRDQHPEALTAISTSASARRITATLEAIESHLSLLQYFERRPEAQEARSLWIEKYLAQVVNSHGIIEPPDFNKSRKIPINDLYVAPSFSEEGDEDGASQDFHSMIKRIDRTVILGDPGGGKSTFTAALATHYARESDHKIIPFHVTLRDYAKHNEDISILEYINRQLSARYQCQAPDRAVEGLLSSGEAAVIFDGLDELIDSSKRRFVTSQVESFGIAYPLTKILVTSRRVGYAEARVDPNIFRSYRIGDFDDSDVGLFVKKWFESQGNEDFAGESASKLADSFLEQSKSVPDLRKNPLMLSLMCIIFKGENFIPRSRPEVYKRCATLLFEKWDGHRSIEVPLRAKDHIDPAMKFFAHWVITSNQAESGVPYSILVQKMTDYLHPRAFNDADEARRAAEEFINFCKGRAWVFSDAGTTPDGESLWKFTHRTFMEYFTAAHLNRIHDRPEELARVLLPKVAAQEWDVIAQLAIQIANDKEKGTERALNTMLRERRKRTFHNRQNVLAFIARCLDFAVVSESFIEELSDRIIDTAWSDNIRNVDQYVGSSSTSWWALLSNCSRYTAPVSGRLSANLIMHIKSNDDLKRYRCAEILLYCSHVYSSYNLTSRIIEPRLTGWGKFFRNFAVENIDQIKLVAQHKPEVNLFLILDGLEDPESAYDRALRGGANPSSILLEVGRFWRGAPSSMADFFITHAIAYQSSNVHPDVERLAPFFVETVRRSLDTNVLISSKNQFSFRFFFSPSVDELEPWVFEIPQLFDAILLSIIANYEISGKHVFPPSMGIGESPFDLLYKNRSEKEMTNSLDWFLDNIYNEWLKIFVVQWSLGEKNLYS